MEQGTAEWQTWRRQGIGASDASAILGIDPYRTKEDVFLEKTGRGKPFKKNFAMELGNKFEGDARALLYLEYHFDCIPATLSHLSFSFIRASFDGHNENERKIAEIKYMGKKNYDLCLKNNNCLDHHFPQIQQQLFVSNFETCIYTPYTLNSKKTQIDECSFIEIKRDHGYIDTVLMPALTSFWEGVNSWMKKNAPQLKR